MQHAQNFILSQSILIACIIGLIRWRNIAVNFRPFLYYCFADCLTEILVFILIIKHINPCLVTNIYLVLSAVLLLWQFKEWSVFNKNPWITQVLGVILIVIWGLDYFVFHNLWDNSGFFRIVYSFVAVILAITYLNKLITIVDGNILKDSRFLICAALIIFFTFNIFIEIIYFNSNSSIIFKENVFDIKRVINVFTNLVFALAMLWIPKKKNFIMPY
ncbi:hypothetical protein [Pedobacter punctiformis]|uniref:Uncharacterized protein n=1 Tax=Pedobacter punctiformis TaxID=3004097 RepID=A0ABT4L8X7_9SPHI|nr:hypothetical protein [Pedobacter sp. HCMS5-2]MCZ4244345.1 hypothetical protein [Pedobacter sp. HCMS5-2]